MWPLEEMKMRNFKGVLSYCEREYSSFDDVERDQITHIRETYDAGQYSAQLDALIDDVLRSRRTRSEENI